MYIIGRCSKPMKGMYMLDVIRRDGRRIAICRCAECSSEYSTDYYDAKKSRLGHLCKACKSAEPRELTQEILQKLFMYDPETGSMTVRLPQHRRKVGDEIGSVGSSHGYREASVFSTTYLVHRLIWMYMTGSFPAYIDHIDHNKLNNRWDNLREVSNQENIKNCSLSKNSLSRVNGVNQIKSTGKFRAYITINGTQKHLGVFDTVEEAMEARKTADAYYAFHENHGK